MEGVLIEGLSRKPVELLADLEYARKLRGYGLMKIAVTFSDFYYPLNTLDGWLARRVGK